MRTATLYLSELTKADIEAAVLQYAMGNGHLTSDKTVVTLFASLDAGKISDLTAEVKTQTEISGEPTAPTDPTNVVPVG